MKGLNDTSQGTTNGDASRSKSGGKNQSTRPGEWFALTGVSNLPDPATHAYRKDLADTALAGRVIASHYAEPLVRHLIASADLLNEPEGEAIARIEAGAEIRMLDLSRGWAWGYGPDGRVGYIEANAVGI